jgi:hypothetical protein
VLVIDRKKTVLATEYDADERYIERKHYSGWSNGIYSWSPSHRR